MTNPAFNAVMPNTFAFGSYGDMDIITNGVWGPPQSGSWYVALTGGGTDIITMKLAAPLTAGTSYTIIFFDRGYSGFPVYPVQLGLSTVNNSIGSVIYTGPVPSMGVWQQRTVAFIAPNNGQYISVLMNAGALGDWVNVDNFSFANPLPVELISFTGENINNNILLHWTTASELNNAYFNIEKSPDGISFEKIGRVEGSGNSSQTLKYDFDDASPLNGINYYRLKQVDYNGNFKLSETITVKLKSILSQLWFDDEFVRIINNAKNPLTLNIWDATGRLIKQMNITEKELSFSLIDFSTGIYFIQLYNEQESIERKLFKK